MSAPLCPPPGPVRKPIVVVSYFGLQPGFGPIPSIALFNVVGGAPDLIGSTRTLETLEAEGYEVVEERRRKI